MTIDSTISDAEEQCLLHARVSARQAIMKGLNREALADAFMIEALKLAFGLDEPEAARLAQRCKVQALRLLDADYITTTGSDGSPKVVRLLRSESRDGLLGTTALTSRG